MHHLHNWSYAHASAPTIHMLSLVGLGYQAGKVGDRWHKMIHFENNDSKANNMEHIFKNVFKNRCMIN